MTDAQHTATSAPSAPARIQAAPYATPDAPAAGAIADPDLINEDLAPLKKQTWGTYNVFAFWMSDVHSVGGYVTAGTLFALGLPAWQVLAALLIGISLVYVFCNLVSEPSQRSATPFPVVCRGSFGVRGANVPAFIRGVIAVAWYGIQTYLASHSLVILALKAWPELAPWADEEAHGFLGLSAVGVFLGAVALVVSYFSGPMLNFGDISRYGRSAKAVRRGNLLGLPVNFLVFSILVVVTASATVPVYGGLITDPVETVAHLDNGVALALGAFTFMVATIGINIVANFIAPAFDFSTIAPRRISWRMGGMIAAVGSVLLTPWNLYSSPDVIHYTLDTLAAFIGPVFGVLVTWYWVIARRRIHVDHLFTMNPEGRYHYRSGWNVRALAATALGAAVAMSAILVPAWSGLANFSWFLGAGAAAAANLLLHSLPERKETTR